jgi:hypothetical protein
VAAEQARGFPLASPAGASHNLRSQSGISIGIVRQCDYDAGVTGLTAVSALNGVRYAYRHGYTQYFEGTRLDKNRTHAWSKVQ